MTVKSIRSTIPIKPERKLKLKVLSFLFKVDPGSFMHEYREWARMRWKFYMSPNEIVLDLLATMTKNDLSRLRKLPPKSLSNLHHSLGQHIRNVYGLWEHTNPHTLIEGEDLGMRDGVITDIRFPDNLSYAIIRALHSELRSRKLADYITAGNPPKGVKNGLED